MRITGLLCVSLFSLTFFGSVPSAIAQSIIGKWFGSASPQDGIACWVNERRANGTYEINFLILRDGRIRRHREEGTWFQANGLYATLTQKVNGQSTNPQERRCREVYRVIELTASRFKYADIGAPMEFSATKVSDSFTLGEACPKNL